VKKAFLGFIFLPAVISNFNATNVETVVKNEASGENASVHTEITNIVNDKEVKVESNEPGEIKVEMNNGEVKVESTQASPHVIINDLPEESPTDEGKEEMKKEMVEEMEIIQDKIITFLEDFFSRLQTKLFFWR
jgi:hypothetical protein